MNQRNCSDACERSGTSFKGKNLRIFGSEMCYVFYFLHHRCNHRSKRIEAVRFIAAGVEPNKFEIRLHNGAIMCRHVPV